jgi:hypothetical protein
MARKPQRATTTIWARGAPHLMSAEIVVQFATLKRCTTARPSAPSPPRTNTMGDLLVATPLRRPTAVPADVAAWRFARARRNQVARAAIHTTQPYLALQLPAHAVVTLCGASPPHEEQRTGKQRWVYLPVSRAKMRGCRFVRFGVAARCWPSFGCSLQALCSSVADSARYGWLPCMVCHRVVYRSSLN